MKRDPLYKKPARALILLCVALFSIQEVSAEGVYVSIVKSQGETWASRPVDVEYMVWRRHYLLSYQHQLPGLHKVSRLNLVEVQSACEMFRIEPLGVISG